MDSRYRTTAGDLYLAALMGEDRRMKQHRPMPAPVQVHEPVTPNETRNQQRHT